MVIKVKYDGEWVKIPYLTTTDPSGGITDAPSDGNLYGRKNGVWSIINIPDISNLEAAVTANTTAIQNKVDKVNGKQLSTNDYTTEEKNKLAGIETGAEVNEVNEAPTDGKQYARKNGDWAEVTVSGTTDSVDICYSCYYWRL